MKFAPKTESELEISLLLEPGIYPFQVSEAINDTSKNGNEMIKIGLTVWGPEGRIHFVYDYLLEAMAYKLRHFCCYTGLIQKYESGELSANDCINKEGYVEIAIQKGKPNGNGGNYPDINKVKDYVERPGDFKDHYKKDNYVEEDVPF